MRALLALILMFVSLAPSQAQDDAARKYFEDWLGACRNDGYCSATAYVNPNPGNGTNADYVFRVGRHAQETYWELSFSTVATMGLETGTFTIQVDTEAQSFQGPDQVAPYGSVNDFYFLGTGAQTVMDWLAPSRALSVEFTDTDNAQHRADFSLAGLNAALVWIDEMQRRLGSERVAEVPPVGLALASSSGLSASVPAKALAWLAADPECDEEMPEEPQVIDLSDTQRAYILPCWEAAYNRGAKVFIEQSGFITPAFFAEYTQTDGWTATDYLVNADYDPRSKTISTFYRGTGMGNCGSIGKYVWGQYAFRLVEFRHNGDCDATNMPGDFPVVFRAAAATLDLPQGLIDAHNGSGECSVSLDATNSTDVIVRPITETQTYFAVPCATYDGQLARAIYVGEAGQFTMQRFLADDNGELYRTHALFDPVFDPEANRLTTRHYLDAGKTCGTLGVWTWNGIDFEAVEYRAKYDCDGKPGAWPVVEPAFNP